jgi:hypothetical protein
MDKRGKGAWGQISACSSRTPVRKAPDGTLGCTSPIGVSALRDNSAGERLALETERRLETPRAAGVAGLVFSLLFVASMLLIRERPPPGSSAKQIADFYLQQDAGRVTLVGLFLVPFAGIAFVWFIAAIRSHLGEREDRFFATVFLGSGLLFAAMLFAASASAGALIAAVKLQGQPPPDANTFLLARALGFAFLFIFAVRAAAIFVLVASTIGLRTGFLPRWLIFAGYAAGLVFLLVVTYVEWLGFGPSWASDRLTFSASPAPPMR